MLPIMRIPFLCGLLISCLAFADAYAAMPAEQLLPMTTKGVVIVPDLPQLRTQFDKTQVGMLVKDPIMRPFVEDLGRQINEKLAEAGRRLYLDWDEIEEVASGESSLALVQPNGEKEQHAQVALVDVTGNTEKAQETLAIVERESLQDGAKKQTATSHGFQVTLFAFPLQRGQKTPRRNYYALAKDQLVACDHPLVMSRMLGRLARGASDDALAALPAYQQSMAKCAEQFGDQKTHLSWFVEPFGYVEVRRAINGGRQGEGTDLLPVLKKQGFSEAIKGMGGKVAVKTDEHDFLFRTFIYAPPVAGATSDDKYRLAARMLNFPNTEPLIAADWVPREVGTHLTYNWKMQKAFDFSGTLVDEYYNEEIFESMLETLRTDDDGPLIDIRKEIVDHLGERVTIINDYRLPINPDSERSLMAFELTNPAAVSASLNRAMAREPSAKKLMHKDVVIWEIQEEESKEVSALKIDGPANFPKFGRRAKTQRKKFEVKSPFPNSAMAVAFGRLLSATHADFIRELLDKAENPASLAGAADYQKVNAALERLGADEQSFHYFTRTDDANLVNYELMRRGEMPKSKSLIGKMLNGMFGLDANATTRQQQVDASKLPDYQVARRYLGPAGYFARSERDGWMIEGVMLDKNLETE